MREGIQTGRKTPLKLLHYTVVFSKGPNMFAIYMVQFSYFCIQIKMTKQTRYNNKLNINS